MNWVHIYHFPFLFQLCCMYNSSSSFLEPLGTPIKHRTMCASLQIFWEQGYIQPFVCRLCHYVPCIHYHWGNQHFLYAIYYIVQNYMYTYFLQRCNHRQSVISNKMPNQKKNSVIYRPPTSYSNVLLQFETNANPANVAQLGQP